MSPLSLFTDQHLTSPCNMSMSGVRLWKVAMYRASTQTFLGVCHALLPHKPGLPDEPLKNVCVGSYYVPGALMFKGFT